MARAQGSRKRRSTGKRGLAKPQVSTEAKGTLAKLASKKEELSTAAKGLASDKYTIGFTGSRTVGNLPAGLKKLLSTKASSIVHGGASGADTAIANFAKEQGIPTTVHKPDYAAHPGRERYAPIARNKDIVADSDVVIGLWKPGSKGTTFTLNHAFAKGKPTYYADMSKAEPALIKMVKNLK